MENNTHTTESAISTERSISSVADPQSPDEVRERQLQEISHSTRIIVALALHIFIATYLIAFVFLLVTTTVCYFVECSNMENIYEFFSFILIPVLITSLTIIFRFSDTISKIIESFTKTIRQ